MQEMVALSWAFEWCCVFSVKADAPRRFMCICWFNQAIVLKILRDPESIFFAKELFSDK